MQTEVNLVTEALYIELASQPQGNANGCFRQIYLWLEMEDFDIISFFCHEGLDIYN